ncbi:MAG: GMC family oxidoreductase N-terminal domain-containing protein [Gemmatimonadaceae bacterium]
MPPDTTARPLPARRRAALAAITRATVPHAFDDAARGDGLLALVEARIAGLAPHKRRELSAAIGLLGSRLASLFTGLPPKPFPHLSAEQQQLLLTRFAESRFALARTIVQAVRKTILLTEYTTPEAQREVGYHGPYHSRGPAVPWEGALPGTPDDAEPILRAPLPDAVHRQAPRAAALSPLALEPRTQASAPHLRDADTLSADAIVIGTGAGGAVAAARLAEAGMDVLILEAGTLRSGADFTEDEGRMFDALYAEGGQRTTDDLSVSFVQGVGVGGGTTVNWMVMLRTPDWVLDEWATRHGAEGMRTADFAPYFARIEDEVHSRVVPDDAHSPNNRIILDGARQLGWSARAAAINAKDCVRTGFCGYGCRTGAKQGGLQTYLPRAQAAGARLLPDARALRIEVIERGGSFPKKRVTFTHTARTSGAVRTMTAEAPIVVVAGGAVETPVLLQRSQMGGGGTGRFLRLHPTTGLFGIYDREMVGSSGIPLSTLCDEYLRQDRAGYGAWIECPPLHPGLAAVAAPGVGATHRDVMRRFPNIGTLIVLTRDGAQQDHSDGEVRLRRNGTTSIRYALNPADARHMEQGLVAAARLHFAAGAREVLSGHKRCVTLRSPADIDALRGRPFRANDIALFSAHVNGTCRLGSDRQTAGTDPHGEVYGAPGVFVADGSLLPTALGVNPQETIMVLATIVAERIASRRRPG